MIAQCIAIVATVLSSIGFITGIIAGEGPLGGPLDDLPMIGAALGLVAYLFGGLLPALKIVWDATVFGWFLVWFPFNIMTA